MSARPGSLWGFKLLLAPEPCRVALQNAPNMVRMGSPEGRTGLWLRGGGKSMPRSPPRLQKSAPVYGGTGLGLSRAGAPEHRALKPEHGSTLTKVERNA